jgi:dTDP-4-dehydrorhamnose 3,5-epimerase-like enzyme
MIEPQMFSDERGFFLETYQVQRFTAAGIHDLAWLHQICVPPCILP